MKRLILAGLLLLSACMVSAEIATACVAACGTGNVKEVTWKQCTCRHGEQPKTDGGVQP